MKIAARIPPKPKEEFELIDTIVKSIEKELRISDDQMVAFKKDATEVEPPIEEYTDYNDWYKPLLAKLIEERRKIPKEERLKLYRNDEIDQVDTTDLENWSFKGSWIVPDPHGSDTEAELEL